MTELDRLIKLKHKAIDIHLGMMVRHHGEEDRLEYHKRQVIRLLTEIADLGRMKETD